MRPMKKFLDNFALALSFFTLEKLPHPRLDLMLGYMVTENIEYAVVLNL